jgi:hypothetical protein
VGTQSVAGAVGEIGCGGLANVMRPSPSGRCSAAQNRSLFSGR